MRRLAICGMFSVIVLVATQSLSHETITTTVLFDREIVRILDQHCVMCHVENGPSFPLASYEETWLRGRSIRAEILRHHMPPWAAMPGYGQFINDNSLTLRETQFIISWVEGLGPRNGGTVFLNVLDSTAAPRQIVRAQAHFGHWQSGEPQNTRQLPPTTIEAGEADNVKRVVVDLGLKTERRIRSVEYLPGDRRVVRAAFFTVQETGQWLGSWTPWHGVTSLPKTAAYRLPAGSHVVAEIHYRGAKSRVVDQGTLGLFVADATAASLVSDLVLETKEDIPAGTPSKRLRTQVRLTRELSALALRPEIRAGVKSVEVSARKPDGGTTILLFARDFQLDWPTPYIFKDPVRLPAGTELAVTTYYANPTATPQPGGIRLTVSAIR